MPFIRSYEGGNYGTRWKISPSIVPCASLRNKLAEQALELRGRSLEPAGDLLLAHLGAAGPLGERREQGDRYRVQVLP